MRRISLLLALVASLFVTPALADFTGKDASLATITFKNPGACTSVVCVPVFQLYDGTNVVTLTTVGADAVSNTLTGLPTYARMLQFNGTTWDRWQGAIKAAPNAYAAGSLAIGAGVDGWSIPDGATTDVAATAGSAGTVSAKLRLMTSQLNTINTTLGSPFQAGGASQGTGASGAALAGNPFRVGLSDGTNSQNWLAAIALADGVNGNNTGAVVSWLWNGATYDRQRGDLTNGAFVNVKTSVLPTGAGTAANQASQLTQETATATGVGAPADTAWVSGSGSAIAILKNIATGVAGPTTACAGSPCTTVIGATNTEFANVPASTGSGAMNTGTQRMALATDSPGVISAGTPTATAALAANLVAKASAGTLFSFEASADSTLSAAAWWVMIYNATSAPADGAVTPLKCYAVPSGTTSYSAAFTAAGIAFSTGITLGVSTTGCFTKTASTHAFISADFQ